MLSFARVLPVVRQLCSQRMLLSTTAAGAVAPPVVRPIPPRLAAYENKARSVFKTIEFNTSGTPITREFTRQEITSELHVQNRDLRLLDIWQDQSGILVRHKSIIVNLGVIKAIVRHNCVVLFQPDNHSQQVQDVISDLEFRLGEWHQSHRLITNSDGIPYELCAVEEMLSNTCDHLRATLNAITPSVKRDLTTMGQTSAVDIGRSQLFSLLQSSKSLTLFEGRVKQSSRALSDVLNSDEDMSRMYLSDEHKTGHKRRLDQHEEVEIVLETYLKQLFEIASEAAQLKAEIKEFEDFLNIQLDANRNAMMKYDLQISIGTFAVASSSLVAGALGMNLANHFESHPHAFAIVVSVILASSVGISSVLYRVMRRRRLW